MNDEIKIDDLRRLKMAPGEVLVLHVDGIITTETSDRLRAHLESVLQGNKCLVLQKGLSLSVVSPESAACV